MNHEHALQLLGEFQPMPDHPDKETLERYRQLTDHFYHHPDSRCIPLFLNSFAEWENLLIYESVQSVLRRFTPEEVLPHLQVGLQSQNPTIRFWCADTARYFPDVSLLPFVEALLAEEVLTLRMAGVALLERIPSEKSRDLAGRALEKEKDEETRKVLALICN